MVNINICAFNLTKESKTHSANGKNFNSNSVVPANTNNLIYYPTGRPKDNNTGSIEPRHKNDKGITDYPTEESKE